MPQPAQDIVEQRGHFFSPPPPLECGWVWVCHDPPSTIGPAVLLAARRHVATAIRRHADRKWTAGPGSSGTGSSPGRQIERESFRLGLGA